MSMVGGILIVGGFNVATTAVQININFVHLVDRVILLIELRIRVSC